MLLNLAGRRLRELTKYHPGRTLEVGEHGAAMLDDLCFGGGLSVRQLDEGTGRFPPLVVQAIAIVAVSALIAGGIWRADSEDPPAPAQAVPSNEESPPKLAVLPFVNLSDDPEQEYFSDGVSEDILTALAGQETLMSLRP